MFVRIERRKDANSFDCCSLSLFSPPRLHLVCCPRDKKPRPQASRVMKRHSSIDAVRRGVWKSRHAGERPTWVNSIAQQCPADLLALVFSYLSAPADRCAAVRVCVAWHMAMRHEPSRQSTFYALTSTEQDMEHCWPPKKRDTIRANILPTSIACTLSAFVHHVTCVRMRQYGASESLYVTAPQAGRILAAFPMLRICALRIGFLGRASMHRRRRQHAQRTWDSLSHGLRVSTRLQELDIDMCWDNDRVMALAAARPPSWSSMIFSNAAHPSFADTTALVRAIGTCVSLRSLRLWVWEESGAQHVDLAPLTQLPLLEHLDLAWTLFGERCKCMGLGSDLSRTQARVLATLPQLTSFNVLDGECTRSFRSMLRIGRGNHRLPSPFATRLRKLHLQNALLTPTKWVLLSRMLADVPIHTIHLDYTSLPAKKESSASYPCFPSVRTLHLSREFEDDIGFRDYTEGSGFADRHEYDNDDTLYRLQRVYQMFPHVEHLVLDEPMPQYLYDHLHIWWTDPTSPYFLHALHSLQLTALPPSPRYPQAFGLDLDLAFAAPALSTG
jgi:hypothetical protein